MSMIERTGGLFQAGTERSLYGNAALIGGVVMGEVMVAKEAPQLFDFGFIAGCLIAVPALGRIIDTLRPDSHADDTDGRL